MIEVSSGRWIARAEIEVSSGQRIARADLQQTAEMTWVVEPKADAVFDGVVWHLQKQRDLRHTV